MSDATTTQPATVPSTTNNTADTTGGHKPATASLNNPTISQSNANLPTGNATATTETAQQRPASDVNNTGSGRSLINAAKATGSMAAPVPTTGDINAHKQQHADAYDTANQGRLYKYHTGLQFLTTFMILVYLGWCAAQLAIVLMNNSVQLQEGSNDSMHAFLTQGLVLAATLFTGWYACYTGRRAGRYMFLITTIFGLFVWMFHLPWITQVYNTSKANNYYCNSSVITGSNYCKRLRTAVTFAVIFEFGQLLLFFYALWKYMRPHPEENIIYPEDEEYAQAAALDVNREKLVTLKGMNEGIRTLTLLSLAGYIILMCSGIKLWIQEVFPDSVSGRITPAMPGYTAGLGDPVLQFSLIPYSVLLGTSLASSAYAVRRINRGITAGAVIVTLMSMLWISSVVIYIGRRPHQENDSTFGSDDNGMLVNAVQRGMAAGVIIIFVGETMRCFLLYQRYRTYLPLVDNSFAHARSFHRRNIEQVHSVLPPVHSDKHGHQNLSAWRYIPLILKLLFFSHLILTLCLWLINFATSCEVGIFQTDASGTTTADFGFIAQSKAFIFHLMLYAASFLPLFYAERIRSFAAFFGAWLVEGILCTAFWILIWPIIYQFIYRDGLVEQQLCQFQGVVTNDFCRLAQAAAVVSVIQIFVLFALWLYALIRMFQQILVKPITHGIAGPIGFFAFLVVAGWAIYGLSAIHDGYNVISYAAAFDPDNFGGVSQQHAFWYVVSFFLIVITTVALWSSAVASHSIIFSNRQSWRRFALGMTKLALFMTFPAFILTCRFLNWGLNEDSAKGIASGLIIFWGGLVLLWLINHIFQGRPIDSAKADPDNDMAVHGDYIRRYQTMRQQGYAKQWPQSNENASTKSPLTTHNLTPNSTGSIANTTTTTTDEKTTVPPGQRRTTKGTLVGENEPSVSAINIHL